MPDIQIAGAVYPDVPAIDVPVSGGGTARYVYPVDVQPSDVNFFDYDGALLYSYTAAQFAALTAMPANPTHDGLVSQGWNWTLADAKTQTASYGACDIGQMYTTSDGKTRFYLSIYDALRGEVTLRFYQANAGSLTIDWGDGTQETPSGSGNITVTHTYSAAGDYVASVSVASGKSIYIGFSSNTAGFGVMLRKVEVGSGVYTISRYGLAGAPALESVTLPNTLSSLGTDALRYDTMLKHITVPSSVTALSSNVFLGNSTMKSVSLPKSYTSCGGNVLYALASAHRLVFPQTTVLSIPNSMFYACSVLEQLIFPSNITSIGSSSFANCTALTQITIPSGVTSIATKAFSGCTRLAAIHFKPSSPPTVGAADAFASLPTDCIIYVPSGKLSAYTGAQNYPSSATYTYREEST